MVTLIQPASQPGLIQITVALGYGATPGGFSWKGMGRRPHRGGTSDEGYIRQLSGEEPEPQLHTCAGWVGGIGSPEAT